MKLQITFEGESLKIIDELKKKTGVKDRGAVLVDAIMLYYEIEKLADVNGKLIVGKNKEKEITIPR